MITIFDLKSEAHMLIDDLCSYGVKKNRIYYQLSSQLKVPIHMAHIGHMATMTQVERAIDALSSMRDVEERKWKHRQKKAKSLANKPIVLALSEQKRILAEMKEGKVGYAKPKKSFSAAAVDFFLAIFQ